MPVELDLGPNAQKFRTELRDWLQANVPTDHDERRTLVGSKEWAKKLRDAGYICVSWPKEYGGRGLTGVEVAVLNEEFRDYRVPRVTRGMGESLVGPSLIVHGTDEQKAHFLPRIIDGVDRYCQGFSEPDAGSDLAGLKTRGIVDGDELIVTGQKVWTSWFRDATMMFCLCRTDPDAAKHRGISYVLIPVKNEDGSSNGVEFRPIKQISGEAHFAETFLNEARAPLFNVIGGLNNGWRVSMTTLGNERGGNATTQHLQHSRDFWRLVEDVKKWGRQDEPLIRQQLAWAYSHVEIMRFSGLRLLAAIADNKDPGPASSINKMFWSEYQRRLGELAMNMQGMESTLVDDGYKLPRWARLFMSSRSHTIWGGTAEIQRNIVGERVLALPKEPSSEQDEEGD